MAYRLKNPTLKHFTHLAGTPPSPFRKKKVAEETSDASNDSTVQENLSKAQVTNDGEKVEYGTKKYKELYDEGSIAGVSVDKEGNVNPSFNLDEVVIRTNKEGDRIDYEKYPFFDDLSEQQKEMFFDEGAIGRGVRRAASTKKGLAEDATSMVTGMLVKQPLAALQTPQSFLVEGIQAARGKDYNFANALSPGSQRTPSQAFNVQNPYGALALDMIADPTNIIGTGLVTKGLKLPNLIKGGLFKSTASPNPVFAGLSKNTVGPSAIDNLPKLNLFSRFNQKTRGQMTAALNELAQTAPLSRAERLKTISRLSTKEGQKRLFNQELGYLNQQRNQYLKNLEINRMDIKSPEYANLSKGDRLRGMFAGREAKSNSPINKLLTSESAIQKQARKNVGYRMKEIMRPNINERAAAAIRGGKLNFSEGKRILYKTLPKLDNKGIARSSQTFPNEASKDYLQTSMFGGFETEAAFGGIRTSLKSQKGIGNMILSRSANNPRAYQHEIQHGLQAGRTMPTDRILMNITPNRKVSSYYKRLDAANTRKRNITIKDKDFFDTYPKAEADVAKIKTNKPQAVRDEEYFFKNYGGATLEPSAYAGELRQSLLGKGFIKNVYDKITPNILSKAQTYFSKNPLYSAPGVSSTRLLDFAAPTKANFSSISKSLNKLPTLATPVLGGSLIFSGDRK